jgi:hypothetical protein
MKKEQDILEILGIGKSEQEKQIHVLVERIATRIRQQSAKQFADAVRELREALDSAKTLLKEVKQTQAKIISKFESRR